MMNYISYIISQIDILLGLFPYASVEYGYDGLAKVHTIEVAPSHICDDDIFQNWQTKAIEGFIDICPSENLCITQKDNILGVGELLYKKEGFGYSCAYSNPFLSPNRFYTAISFGSNKSNNPPAIYVGDKFPKPYGDIVRMNSMSPIAA